MARQNSNVFAMFDQKQIAELKEAFSFIDQNNDGLIDREDLIDIWTSLGIRNIWRHYIEPLLGQDPSDEFIEGMIGATGPLNFTLFLTLMGERVQGGDSEADLLEAFEQLDEKNSGEISLEQLRSVMMSGSGPDRMTGEEVDLLLRDTEVGKTGQINYRDFVRSMKQTC